LKEEIVDSKTELQKLFPGQEVICFVGPGGAFMDDLGRNERAMEIVRETYEGARSGSRGVNKSNMRDIYAIKIFGFTTEEEHKDGVEVAAIRAIDNVVKGGGWLVQMWHGLDIEPGYAPQNPQTADNVFAHIKELVDGDYLEVMFLSEGVKYIKEFQNSTLGVKSDSATKRVLSLTDTLDDTIFYYPLTLKSAVPDTWRQVKVTQGDTTVTVRADVEKGEWYVVYDAVPDGGDITLEVVK